MAQTLQQVEFKFDIYHSVVHLGYATYHEPDAEAVKKHFVENEGYPHDIVVILVKDRK